VDRPRQAASARRNEAAVEARPSLDELRAIAIAVGTFGMQGARLQAQMVTATGR
jgi:hypothetical protein